MIRDRKAILVIKEDSISQKAVEKLNAMRKININISAFIEWAIMNFNIEVYQKVMQCK